MRDFVKHLDKRWGERSVVWLLVFAFFILVCICGAFFIRDEHRNAQSAQSDSSYAFTVSPMGSQKLNGGEMRTVMMSRDSNMAYSVSPSVSQIGSVEMEVGDVSAVTNSIGDIAKKSSGYVESSSIRGDSRDGGESVITIRVPQERFDAVIQEIEGQAIKISKVTTEKRDVSSAISTSQAMLASLQSLEAGYQTILDDAKDTNEAVTLTNQLAEIKANIQNIQARMNYLYSENSMASITVSVREGDLRYGTLGVSFLILELSFILLVLAGLLKTLKHISKKK